jgi:hypothetical protein
LYKKKIAEEKRVAAAAAEEEREKAEKAAERARQKADFLTSKSSFNQVSIDKESDHCLGRVLVHGYPCSLFATIDNNQAGLTCLLESLSKRSQGSSKQQESSSNVLKE